MRWVVFNDLIARYSSVVEHRMLLGLYKVLGYAYSNVKGEYRQKIIPHNLCYKIIRMGSFQRLDAPILTLTERNLFYPMLWLRLK